MVLLPGFIHRGCDCPSSSWSSPSRGFGGGFGEWAFGSPRGYPARLSRTWRIKRHDRAEGSFLAQWIQSSCRDAGLLAACRIGGSRRSRGTGRSGRSRWCAGRRVSLVVRRGWRKPLVHVAGVLLGAEFTGSLPESIVIILEPINNPKSGSCDPPTGFRRWCRGMGSLASSFWAGGAGHSDAAFPRWSSRFGMGSCAGLRAWAWAGELVAGGSPDLEGSLLHLHPLAAAGGQRFPPT